MALIRSYPPNVACSWRRVIRALEQHVTLFRIVLYYALQAGKIELGQPG
jgi:hypothetical protein